MQRARPLRAVVAVVKWILKIWDVLDRNRYVIKQATSPYLTPIGYSCPLTTFCQSPTICQPPCSLLNHFTPPHSAIISQDGFRQDAAAGANSLTEATLTTLWISNERSISRAAYSRRETGLKSRNGGKKCSLGTSLRNQKSRTRHK